MVCMCEFTCVRLCHSLSLSLRAVGGIDAEDLFSQIFGGGRGKRTSAARRGGDVQTVVTIPFMEAVNGCTRDVSVMANVRVCECVRVCVCEGECNS